MATFFYATSVNVTNNNNLVIVNAGDDVQTIREGSWLQVDTNPLVEVKRTFLGSGGTPTIELAQPWPYSTATNRPAIAAPTAADLGELTNKVRQLIEASEDIVDSTNVNPVADTIVRRTSNGRVKTTNATESNDAVARGQLGTAAFSNVTTSPTDTTSDRLLKVGDFGVGGTGLILPNNSAADGAPTGIYITDSNTANLNAESVNGTMLVLGRGAGGANPGATQIWRRGFSQISWRQFRNGNPDPWYDFYHTGNILGTVSQESGVPTGAVIQRGSNANGEFVRFADGTQICTTSNILFDVGGGDSPFGVNIPFPADFSTVSGLTGSLIGGSGSDRPLAGTGFAPRLNSYDSTFCGIEDRSNWRVRFDPAYSNQTNFENFTLRLLAIGRWF